jgi:two-component system, OmpR family, response regulator RstA
MTCFDGDRPVILSPSHFRTLTMLIERAPDVISREELRATIPLVSCDRVAASRVVDVHVSRIRRQLHDEGVTSFSILQVRSRGYRAVQARE